MKQNSQELEATARVVTLLELIEHRLHEMLRDQKAASPIARADPHHSYTRRQAAHLLGVSVWTIDKGRKEGLLIEARCIGHRAVRITGHSLLKFMAARESASVQVRKL